MKTQMRLAWKCGFCSKTVVFDGEKLTCQCSGIEVVNDSIPPLILPKPRDETTRCLLCAVGESNKDINGYAGLCDGCRTALWNLIEERRKA